MASVEVSETPGRRMTRAQAAKLAATPAKADVLSPRAALGAITNVAAAAATAAAPSALTPAGKTPAKKAKAKAKTPAAKAKTPAAKTPAAAAAEQDFAGISSPIAKLKTPGASKTPVLHVFVDEPEDVVAAPAAPADPTLIEAPAEEEAPAAAPEPAAAAAYPITPTPRTLDEYLSMPLTPLTEPKPAALEYEEDEEAAEYEAQAHAEAAADAAVEAAKAAATPDMSLRQLRKEIKAYYAVPSPSVRPSEYIDPEQADEGAFGWWEDADYTEAPDQRRTPLRGLPISTGVHTRFDDDGVATESPSTGSLQLRGVAKWEGTHVRFDDDAEESA